MDWVCLVFVVLHTRRMWAGSLSFVRRADWVIPTPTFGKAGRWVLRPVPGRPPAPSLALLRPAFPVWHLSPQRPCSWTCLISVTDPCDAVVRVVRESALLRPIGCWVLWVLLPSLQSSSTAFGYSITSFWNSVDSL